MADDFKAQIDAIVARYKPILDDLARRGKQLADDFSTPGDIGAVIGIDFKVDWKDEEIIFDLPSITMKTKDISLDIPEIRMDRQEIKFHTPSVRMVTKKVGQYPEFDGWTIRWKDILIDVPEVFMEEQRIVYDIPSITMKTQNWSFDIPEFTMERTRWVVSLPQFTVINISAKTTEIKEAGAALKSESEQVAARMKAEIDSVLSGTAAGSTQANITSKNKMVENFDSAIAALNKAITDLVARGVDPIKVPTSNGDVNLRKQLQELISQRDAAAAAADTNMAA